jgi:hypothetical protein
MSEKRTTEIMEIELEDASESSRVIDLRHSKIHQGNFYISALKFTLATTATKKIVFKTGSKVTHHQPMNIKTSKDNVDINVYENATVTAATGTNLDANNYNRNSSNTATAVLIDAPTVTVQGTELKGAQDFLAGAVDVGQRRSGGETGRENEWILKPNTNYNIEIYNGSADNNIIMVHFTWYEID